MNPSLMGAGINLGGQFLGANSWKNPADSAMPYLNQMRDTITPYYQPYMQAGQQAMGALMPQYQSLMSNPSGALNQMGQGYQASPGYQYNVDQATKAANQAAAAGGMVGSPAEQQSLAGNISGMASQDYNTWLSNVLGLYGQGMQGMQGINQMGFNANSDMANSLGNNLNSQANLAYAGQMGANQNKGGLIGGAAKAIGSLF